MLGIHPSLFFHELANLAFVAVGFVRVDFSDLIGHVVKQLGSISVILCISSSHAGNLMDHHASIADDLHLVGCHRNHGCHACRERVNLRRDVHSAFAHLSDGIINPVSVKNASARRMDLNFQRVGCIFDAVSKLAKIRAIAGSSRAEYSFNLLNQPINRILVNGVVEFQLSRFVFNLKNFHHFPLVQVLPFRSD